jgi:hypothetical protein
VRPVELDNAIFFVGLYVDSTIYSYFEQYLQHISLTKTYFVCSCKHYVASC